MRSKNITTDNEHSWHSFTILTYYWSSQVICGGGEADPRLNQVLRIWRQHYFFGTDNLKMKVLINAVWTLVVLFTSSAPLFQGYTQLGLFACSGEIQPLARSGVNCRNMMDLFTGSPRTLEIQVSCTLQNTRAPSSCGRLCKNIICTNSVPRGHVISMSTLLGASLTMWSHFLYD